MKNVALVGDLHECSIHRLEVNQIVSSPCGSVSGGRQIAVVGSITTCGAVIVEGSQQWVIDGRQVATLDSKTMHMDSGATGKIVRATADMKIS